jgi:uncharacterized protein YndB with AHSA1/START domain
MTKPSYVYVTYIRASADKVWDALTNGEVTKKYWAHANVSDWSVGSKWEHQRSDGSGVIDITGKVIESDKPKRLVVSWASPEGASDPNRISRVSYDIAPHTETVVKLTVTHSELEAGSQMETGITRGWPLVLSSLKSFLETGEAVPFKPTCGTN